MFRLIKGVGMLKSYSMFLVMALGLVLYPVLLFAQGTSTVDLSNVTLDTASVLALAAIVLTAIGAIWGIKKLIKLANRS